MATNFLVNGKAATTDAPPDTPLLWVIREDLKLTGTKFGCGAGLCGACMVHIDDKRAFSCQTQVSEVAGKSVTTIEGLSPYSNHPVQKAWLAERVPQCGYCQSGQIMSAADLLKHNPKPTPEQIVEHMSTNSAVAAPISASCARSSARRGRRDMNANINRFETAVSRRQVMMGAAGLSFAIALGGSTNAAVIADERTGQALSPWVSIAPDGTITIMAAATEMGQGSMTSLPLIIAEELDADWNKVKIVPAPVIEKIYGNPGFGGMMYTAGSNAVTSYYKNLRLFGAQTRRVLSTTPRRNLACRSRSFPPSRASSFTPDRAASSLTVRSQPSQRCRFRRRR